MSPELITFDLGGTLITPCPSVGEIYAEAISSHGHPADAGRMNQRFPAAMKQWTDAGNTGEKVRDDQAIWREIFRETALEEAVPVSAFETVFQAAFHSFAKGGRWKLAPSALATLEKICSMGIRLAVLSNSDRRSRDVLRELEIIDFFEAVFLSGEIGYEKPDLRIFQHVAQAMNVVPEKILHVGDSPRHDQTGAESAGWRSYLVEYGTSALADLPGRL